MNIRISLIKEMLETKASEKIGHPNLHWGQVIKFIFLVYGKCGVNSRKPA